MAASTIRQYHAQARSTEALGRVLCSARHHHFIIDGPQQAGFPGEALGPGEAFLAGVAACGVELVQALARDDGMALKGIKVDISGMMDRSKPVRPDVTLFNAVALDFELDGVTESQAESLVERFRGR
ncbi:MAG: OsmC family protein [Hyphomicrobiaceae bacterium]